MFYLRQSVMYTTFAMVVFLSILSSSSAAPLSYNESIHGDLPGTGNLTILALDIGTNTITGTETLLSSSSWDKDAFAFTIPAGAQLTFGSLSAVDVTNDITTIGWRINAGSSVSDQGTLLTKFATFSPGSTTIDGLPLSSGLYNMSNNGLFGGDILPASVNYTFTLNVTAIPEPSCIALAASGAGACLLILRKRTSIA